MYSFPVEEFSNLAALTLIAEHQGHGQEPVLASGPALDARVLHFESVDEEEGQEDDILHHLGHRHDAVDPLLELGVWRRALHQSRNGSVGRAGSDGLGCSQDIYRLEPKEARHLGMIQHPNLGKRGQEEKENGEPWGAGVGSLCTYLSCKVGYAAPLWTNVRGDLEAGRHRSVGPPP